MNHSTFDGMPDDARLWIYGFDKKIDPRARERIAADLEAFVRSWMSHDAPVHGSFEIVEDRFVLLAGFCEAGLGGCSIDESIGIIRLFKERYGLDGLNRGLVWIRNGGGEVEALALDMFRRGIENGAFGGKTVVFDVTLTTLADLRHGKFETTFDNSWHARAFAA